MRKLIVLLLALGLWVVPVLAQDTGTATGDEIDSAPTTEASTTGDESMTTGEGAMQPETTTGSSLESRATFLPPTIVDVVNDNFVYLAEAIANSGLTPTLESREYTLFAPNDGAFTTLVNDLGMSLDELMGNQRLLEVILSYHVIPGSVRSEDIASLSTMDSTQTVSIDTSTILGPALSFGMNTDVSRVVINGGEASIEQADLEATNGLIHVIDNVLLPPDWEALAAQPSTLTETSDTTDNTVETSQSAADYVAKNFVILEAAVEAAGLQDELASGEITLFAPTDGAFTTFLAEQGMSEAELLSNPDLLTQVLEYHIVPGSITADELQNNAVDLQSSQDAVPSFSFDQAISRVTIDGGRASVVAQDIAVSNGIVHVIDNVLNPPGMMSMQ